MNNTLLDQSRPIQVAPRDYLHRTLVGEIKSRPAIAFWQHHPIADQSAQSLADAALAFYSQVGGDLLKITPAGTYQATALGLRDEWQGDALGRRTIISRPIKTPQNWLHLDKHAAGHMEDVAVEAALRIRERIGKDLSLIATVFSPVTQALQMSGPDVLAQHARLAPDNLRHGLEILVHRTCALLKRYRAAGVDGVYLALQHCVPHMQKQEDYIAHGRWADEAVIAACDMFDSRILHLHGAPLHSVLPRVPSGWALHFELSEFNPTPLMLKQQCGPPLVAGLSIAELASKKTSDAIRQRANSILDEFNQHTGLITGGCVLPLDFPLAQARTWVDTIQAM